MESLLI